MLERINYLLCGLWIQELNLFCKVDLIGMTGDITQGKAGISEVGSNIANPVAHHGHIWVLLNSSITGLEWEGERDSERKSVSWARAAMEKDGQENRAIQTANILFHFIQDVHGN